MLPRLVNTIQYINSELDEMEREEIFRIKKVLELKRKHEAAEATEREEFAQDAIERAGSTAVETPAGAGGAAGAGAGAAAAGPSMLDDDSDSDDIIF